ncbi:unnamed protein product [Polarella glacialis]|uniref:Uncharacterized protein n=1 Tax=Polarella glacialis TaxID=89957 RepID=A0A813JQF1_POLGL|nr:unnamed protein product [Polarella glacialis]
MQWPGHITCMKLPLPVHFLLVMPSAAHAFSSAGQSPASISACAASSLHEPKGSLDFVTVGVVQSPSLLAQERGQLFAGGRVLSYEASRMANEEQIRTAGSRLQHVLGQNKNNNNKKNSEECTPGRMKVQRCPVAHTATSPNFLACMFSDEFRPLEDEAERCGSCSSLVAAMDSKASIMSGGFSGSASNLISSSLCPLSCTL